MTNERMMEILNLLQKAGIPNEVITLLLDQHLRLEKLAALADKTKKTYSEWPCNDGTVDIVEHCACCGSDMIVRHNLAAWQVPHELESLRQQAEQGRD